MFITAVCVLFQVSLIFIIWVPSLMFHYCFRNRLFERTSGKNASVMASPEVAIWKLAGSNLPLLTSLDQNWNRNTAQLSEYHFWTTSFTSETTTETDWWLGEARNWFIWTCPQTTVCETLPPARLECWEGHAKVTLDLPGIADLFVPLVICDTKQ